MGRCLASSTTLAVVCFLSVSSAIRGDEPQSNNADAQAVLQLLRNQEAAWNNGDLKGFMQGYWNSPKLSFFSGRDKRNGWRETYERYRERYQKPGSEMGKLTFSDLTAEPLSKTTMLVRGRWKLDMSKQSVDGLFSLIVQNKPEGWRIVHDHTSAGDPIPKQPRP